MKYTEIKNFIKNNNLITTHMYSEKRIDSRRITYCVLRDDKNESQKKCIENFSKNNNLCDFKVTQSKYTPYFPRYYLRFTVKV